MANTDTITTGKSAILAVDLGSVIGWATRGQTNGVEGGSERFNHGSRLGRGIRFLRFKEWLDKIHREQGPFDRVFYEDVKRHLGTDAAHVYGGFLAVLAMWAEYRGVPYVGVPVGTIKKHATGSGSAKKADMIAAMTAAGFAPQDDNHADALALLLYGIAQEKPRRTVPESATVPDGEPF